MMSHPWERWKPMQQSNDLEPVRFSRLKLMGKSAAHFKHGFGPDTGFTRKGTGLHSFMIGDSSRVKVYAGARNKKHKKYREFLEENPDCQIMSRKEMRDVEGMRKSLDRHPRALELLDGIREQRITWEMCGRACAGTPDVVHIRGGKKILVELKTSVSSSPYLFKWQAKRLCYHGQIGWYSDGLEKTNVYAPGPVVEQYIVVVESVEPYPVTVIKVDDSMKKKGQRQCRLWLEQLLVCEATGHFPGYVESDETWADDDLELEFEDEEAA